MAENDEHTAIPDEAAKPQDRRAKKPKKTAAEAEATDSPLEVEHSGVTYLVDPDAYNNMDMVELLDQINLGHLTVLPRMLRLLIGPDQYTEFKDANRDPDTGIAPSQPLWDLFHKIDTALGE
jgi:hypothetical protein